MSASQEVEKADDYYEVLGVARDATADEIKAAYRKRARETHPDREGGSVKEFQRVQRAYAILSDERKRARYDASGESGGHAPTPRDEALQNLALLFSNLINNNLNNLERVDLISLVEENIEQNRSKPRQQIRQYEKRLAKIEGAERRLKRKSSKESINLFESILDQEKRVCRNMIKAAKDGLEMMRIMSEINAEYGYDFDQAPKTEELRPGRDDALDAANYFSTVWGSNDDQPPHPGNGVSPEDDAAERREKRRKRWTTGIID